MSPLDVVLILYTHLQSTRSAFGGNTDMGTRSHVPILAQLVNSSSIAFSQLHGLLGLCHGGAVLHFTLKPERESQQRRVVGLRAWARRAVVEWRWWSGDGGRGDEVVEAVGVERVDSAW